MTDRLYCSSCMSSLRAQYVAKGMPEPPKYYNPQVMMDYRCYLPGGKEEMGTNYPPKVGYT